MNALDAQLAAGALQLGDAGRRWRPDGGAAAAAGPPHGGAKLK